MMSKQSLFSLTKDDLNLFLREHSFSENLSTIILQTLYKKKKNFNLLSDSLKKTLENNFDNSLPEITEKNQSDDGTVKFLMTFSDGQAVETVLIPFHKKYTVCLSTQVGCAMKCSFCYTGTMGLKRNLSAGEIVGQFLAAWNFLREIKPDHRMAPNIVFMGQGEPLHNSEEVLKSIEVMMEPMGLAIGPRQMTLSTAGYLPGLKKFLRFPQVNLALSLHSPFNEIRKTLIPINDLYPLEDIFYELDIIERSLLKKQFITFEYLLIKGINDRSLDADELKKLLGARKAIINIIPFNPYPGSAYQRPGPEEVDAFKDELVARGLRTMVRTTKGSEILAACGQLKSAVNP